MDQQTERVSCTLCGHDDTKPRYAVRDWLHDLPGQFNVVQCRHCGLVYLNPRPTGTSLLQYYPADYVYAPASASPETLTLRHKLWLTLLSRYYGYPIVPPALPVFIRLWVGLYHRLYGTLALPILPWRPNGQLLDVGCGKGDYLTMYRQLGWSTQGVEINPHAVQYARQQLRLDIFEGDFLAAHFPAASFDAVTMWWYLEHVPNPLEVLQEARRVLKSDGGLWIGVPNAASLEASIFGPAWYHLDAPRHFYLYTLATLTALLARAGLRLARQYHISWLNDPAQSIGRWLKIRSGRARPLPAWMRGALAPAGWLIARAHMSSVLIVRTETAPA